MKVQVSFRCCSHAAVLCSPVGSRYLALLRCQCMCVPISMFPDGRSNGTWLPKTVLTTAEIIPLLTYPLREKSVLGFEPAAVQVTLRTKSGVRASHLCLPGAKVSGVHTQPAENSL